MKIRVAIQSFWLVHPREANIAAYALLHNLEPIGTFYNMELDTWICTFKPSANSPCNRLHSSNNSYVYWVDIRDLMRCSTRFVEGTGQAHAVVESGWGKLLHKCHDADCTHKVWEVPYCGHMRSYAEVGNLLLADWVYMLTKQKHVVVFKFLVQ